jgi:arylsulfatase A-like enzyme
LSSLYIETITIGRLRDTLATEGVLTSYTTLLLADHGGSGSHHQQPTPEVLTVPFIAHGERITPGFTISRPVSVIDLALTAAHLMNITPHWLWEGNAITEMLR